MLNSVLDKSTKKFAVIIGINYFNTPNQLNGCINDANHLKEFLIEKAGYLPENILLLTDDANGLKPTKQNIINAFNTLVSKALNEGFTELWLSYSGHGSYVDDLNRDEKDFRDEALCPSDFATSGLIIDDFIYDNLISKLPSTTTLFSLMDCCHSGTILDLPLIYNTSMIKNNTHIPLASVISISGCKDDQTSDDAYINNSYAGAMTWSFLNALSKANYNISLIDLVNNMKVLLKRDHTQIPLLALSFDTDFNKKFIQVPPAQVNQLVKKTTKMINFKLTTDYWFHESSWNVWSVDKNMYVFPTNNVFTEKKQTVDVNKQLESGKYKLCVFDTSGDGGVTSIVSNGAITLVHTKMYTGSLGEYAFEVL